MSFFTLDNFATWMLTNVRLSRYDNQFVNNLTLYITQHNRITSNQDTLFRKVSKKYHRQCLHRQINVDEVLGLKWSVPIVESIPEFTGANIRIEDNKIIFRSPYNKNFLAALRKIQPYNFNWLKEKRCYEGPYSLTSLKKLVHVSADHFEIINYCDRVKQIIDTLSVYESAKYWVPTLIYNGQYYIAAINDSLYNVIKDIEISDDLASISQLVKYGVNIDESVEKHLSSIYDSGIINLALNFHVAVEVNDTNTILDWLQQLGCDAIAESRLSQYSKRQNGSLLQDVLPKSINFCDNLQELKNYTNPIVVYSRGTYRSFDPKPLKLFKIVKFVNSEPVNLNRNERM